MRNTKKSFSAHLGHLLNHLNLGLRAKLIIIFLIAKVIPLIVITVMAWQQIIALGVLLRDIAVSDSSAALNDRAIESIERQTTDTAQNVAEFLYGRDDDIRYLATLEPSEENFRNFSENRQGRLIKKSQWALAPDGSAWERAGESPQATGGLSTNSENNDMDGFNTRPSETFAYEYAPLYDEITFIDLSGNETVKYVTPNSTKKNYPLSTAKRNVSEKENTYVKAEDYFGKLQRLKPGDIYVSDVIGAYVGSNYIGMYVPDAVAGAAETRGYDIPYDPEKQAYAGEENPNGARFEGIVRWATPVTGSGGDIVGYLSFALNHDHIMEFVDHITPMDERYTELPSAFEGNYAFIWDYQCRSICHPRHHSIVGYDPETGDEQVPWLESSIYDAWQASGVEKWTDFIRDWPTFDEQSRTKKPAPALTQAGLVGLDGRYLNNAPQCTGWMDLTQDGGSGSFYILWSGLYKLTTAAAIPYYTGQYAPSEDNAFSKRGFGIVTIGAGLEHFTHPATLTEEKLVGATNENLNRTFLQLLLSAAGLVVLVVLVAIWLASYLTTNITTVIKGVSRFRAGERQFRFNSKTKDEFGMLEASFDDMANSVVGSVNSPLSITDMDLRIIYMNDYGLELCKLTLSEIVGTLYSQTSVYPFGTQYCPITALREGREAEAFYIADPGLYVKGVANYLRDKDGNRIGYIIVSTDVTEIQNAVDRAEQASRAKSDFLSNMSHEMRTPMNAIIGMTSIAKSADDIERKDYCLEKIDNASTHLLGVINDILDMSKIEANKFELSPTEFVFEKMLQKVVGVINFRMEEKKQNFTVRIDDNIPQTLICDDQRLAQVITNLLSNAVKFTPEEGSIHLGTHFIKEEEGLCSIRFEVSDTGIGISEEQKERLFTSFEQAESSTSRKFGGTGLGLAISKRIVEMMGGDIGIHSVLGSGSTFTFTIQARRGEEIRRSLLSPGVSWDNMRILAVDDMPDIREYFDDVARRFGIQCDTAAGGEESLALIRQHGPYDLYFVDWKMPGMDGVELTRRIKQSAGGKSVVIMISATEWSLIESEARDAGVDKFLSKPLFPSALADIINECLGLDASAKETAPAETIESFDGYRVLLAEDVDINREIVMALLEPTALAIDCAENGKEALRQFSETPERYDMIFMDVQMPEMDGYEATRRIRALDAPNAKTVPIIAMTANVFREDIEKCLAAGMNDHVGKPLDFDEVLARLHKYIKVKH